MSDIYISYNREDKAVAQLFELTIRAGQTGDAVTKAALRDDNGDAAEQQIAMARAAEPWAGKKVSLVRFERMFKGHPLKDQFPAVLDQLWPDPN